MKRISTTNAVLLVALAVLVAWLVMFAVRGSAAAPGTTPSEARAEQYADVTRAARSETLAFLAVDHRKMDQLTKRVLEGATGEFKKQYETSLKSLKDAAVSQESISTGHVDQIGLGDVDDDSASVFVAASSKVQNKGTKGKVEDRSWRMKLTMAKVDNRWLVRQLEFVG
ncbi:Mce-associated membrane protein [Aeromicrobium panaciterrae]|uniref:Mce-associated membrane protein n=1 Tax=Aeromicrobium panaciterrae TaxID=363861 RepID=A0ABU1UJF8_9ACTN|nr:hypothetical protein [Aeromicrobium panaciterrae]MDR7085298.1 Mce-associated membrane protein [Aeromicrobium panaciterrae]